VAIDDVLYLQQMYDYEDGVLRTVCDGIGAHAGGFNNPPEDWFDRQTVSSTTFKGHPSFYFRRLEQLREIMVLRGDSEKRMWVTEFGWSTNNLAPGYEYGRDNTDADQASYLVRAYQMARDWGWVGGMFVWNLNFQQVVPSTDEKFPFGITRPDGSPRPAYIALKFMAKHS
jgi:polysaccharide biosynthesis protein PslG